MESTEKPNLNIMNTNKTYVYVYILMHICMHILYTYIYIVIYVFNLKVDRILI